MIRMRFPTLICEQNGQLLPNWRKKINGVEVPLVILGDPAYPLLT